MIACSLLIHFASDRNKADSHILEYIYQTPIQFSDAERDVAKVANTIRFLSDTLNSVID